MLDRYNLFLQLLSLTTVIIVIVFSFRMYRIIHRPLQGMVRALRKVENGDLNISLSHGKHDEFKYLFGQFNLMVNRLRELIREVYEENGMLKISVSAENDGLVIAIEDNGDHLEDTTLLDLRHSLTDETVKREITGLLNVHRRLRLFFGQTAGLHFARSGLGGMKVTIEITHKGESGNESFVDCG